MKIQICLCSECSPLHTASVVTVCLIAQSPVV